MKAGLIALGLVFTLAGCGLPDVPQVKPKEPTRIEGLELTFSKPVEGGLYSSVNFLNESAGYITTLTGAILKTTDAGNSWKSVTTPTGLALNDLYFVNDNDGWAVGGKSDCAATGCIPIGAILLRTKDAGDSWESVTVANTKRTELASITFVNPTKGFAVGYSTILETLDGGATWNETTIDDLGAIMKDIKFFGELNGLITCSFGKVVRTHDGGNSWTVSNPFPAMGANSLSLPNGSLAYSAGYTTFHKSLDFGKTWTTLPSFPENIQAVEFISETMGFALGRGLCACNGGINDYNHGSLFYTKDGGQTWTGTDNVYETRMLLSASIPTATTGYALSLGELVKIKIK
jgi:photosystem II stability/assembly factor-like uncharacterized protein